MVWDSEAETAAEVHPPEGVLAVAARLEDLLHQFRLPPGVAVLVVDQLDPGARRGVVGHPRTVGFEFLGFDPLFQIFESLGELTTATARKSAAVAATFAKVSLARSPLMAQA
jgi:hypothetical protein